MKKIRYPKSRTVGFTLLFFLAFSLSGCCSCRDRYAHALDQWAENLDSLRPTMEAGASALPSDLGRTKMGRYDRTVQGIKRVAGEGPEIWGTTPEGEDE